MVEPSYIEETAFRDRFGVADFVGACRRALELYGRGEVSNPPRQEKVEEGEGGMSHFRLDMPAEWPGRYRARKVIEELSNVASGRLENREAYIELEDLRSGVEERFEAGYITDMRTGSAGALGLEFLHPGDLKRLAILGTGRIARCAALACAEIFALDEVRCTSRKPENRAAFAADMAPQLGGVALHMAGSLEECLDGSEAVLTAVPTPEPILGESDVAAAETIAVIAGDSRTCQVRADLLQGRRVVVDVLAQAQKSGDFRRARERGEEEQIALARNDEGAVLTLGDAACGRVPRGRGVAYLTGMAAQDLCAAAMIHEALARGG